MSHYDWLDKNLNDFWVKATSKSLEDAWCGGIVSAHGDKCYCYKSDFETAGIPFHHGVAVYLLTHARPYSVEVRETENGWVDPYKWVIDNYQRFKPMLNP